MSDQHTTFQDPTCQPIYTHRHAQTLSLTRHANMRNIFSETRGIGHSPFKDLEVKPRFSQNGQKHIWLSLFLKVQWIVLRTITHSLPQITQHRHCIGSPLDIVSSATNWNELVSDAITVQLQLNPTPELAIDGNSSAIVWRLSTNAIRLQYQKSLQLWAEEEIIIKHNLNNVCWET